MTWTATTLVPGSATAGVHGSPTAYLFAGQGSHHVVVRSWEPTGDDTRADLIEHWSTADGDAGVTALGAGVGAVADDYHEPTGYVFESEGTQHVLFLAAGHPGRLQELWWDGEWHAHDLLDQVPGSVAEAAGPASGYGFAPSFERSQHVVYRSVDGHVHELTRGGGSWSTYDLTAAAGARHADGDPVGFAADVAGTQHVAYRATRAGEVDVLTWRRDRGWRAATVNTPPGTGRAVGFVRGVSFESAGTLHVVYASEDGHVWESASDDGDTWAATDIWLRSGAPESAGHAAGDGLAAFVLEAGAGGPQPSLHVVHRGHDRHVHDLHRTASGDWTWTDLTAAAGAPLAAEAPAAFADPVTGTQHVYLVTDDHALVELTGTPVRARLGTVVGRPVDVHGLA